MEVKQEEAAPKKKTNGKRNRAAGHAFELTCVNAMKAAGFKHVVSCRSESRSRDNDGIDLINKHELINGRLPYNVQCKNVKGVLKYHEILERMPDIKGVTNVIFHKMTRKAGDTFQPVGTFAILDMRVFLQIAAELERLKSRE